MDDKDRLGDKLRDKGKASEDLYIAEQERLRLERRRQAAVVPGGTGACPKDGTKLEAHEARGVTIDICPTCQGMWLDKGEVDIVRKLESESAVIGWVLALVVR